MKQLTGPTTGEVLDVQRGFEQVRDWLLQNVFSISVNNAIVTISRELDVQEQEARKRAKGQG
ncbi:MAG: hypothetical protein WC455_24480 [Dehalococcoidia bacterium]|jgi:hypothetical protein